MAAAAAIIIKKEKELIKVFQRRRATTPATALSISDLDIEDDHTLHRLKRDAIVREAGSGMLYFDEASWNARNRRRRRLVVVMLCIAIAISLILLARTNHMFGM